jgi:hypothetical protein
MIEAKTSDNTLILPDCDIDCFTKDVVPLIVVRDDLSIPTGDIQDDRIGCLTNDATHFDMSHEMIHTNQRFVPQQR